ncbi:hypothetical protein pb186bvf_007046 [Paramecium bursaria]
MRQILMMYLLVRSQSQPKLTVPVQDLKSQSFTLSSWTSSSSSYTTTFTQCNQLLMKLISSSNFYQKTFTIKDYEYDQVFIELDVYFIQFTACNIKILANSLIIYQQTFTNISQNNVCSSAQDYQQTIFANFYTTSASIIIQIQYQQTISNANSFLGIRNLNLYTNGISLINGCKMSAPLLQSGPTCVQQCTVANPYLKGATFTSCTAASNTNSALLAYIVWTDSNSWIFQGANPISSYVQTCQTTLLCLVSNGTYTNVFTNSYMTSQYQQTRLIALKVSMRLASDYFQVVFIVYLFGKWDDGSYIALFVNGPTNMKSNIVTIQKQMGYYYSSTGSQIYSTNLTNNNNGSIVQAQKTQIAFSACFSQAQFTFEWTQYLSGTDAAYGIGDFQYYFALNVPTCTTYAITGICIYCSGSSFAYNGICLTSCPAYTVQATGNCTDYSQTESQMYNPSINVNGFGLYILRDFYDYRFQTEYINNLFTFQPPEYRNYYNSQSFSFIDSSKILGGFNSWGYGSFTKLFQNLLDHYQLRIYCSLYLLDQWQSGDSFQILVDGLIVFNTQQTQSVQLAGLSTGDQLQTISLKIAHTYSSLKLEFRCTLANQDPRVSSCGIQNLFVLIDQNIKLLCPTANTYFSYYTKQCESCYRTNCFLYPMKQPIICSIGCLVCTSSTVCTSCDTIHGYALNGNLCSCSNGYILKNGQCVNCHYSCNICVGILDNQCTTSCDQTRTLINGQCACNSPLVDVGILQCQVVVQQNPLLSACNYRCQTCFGTLYNQCLSCSSGNNRVYNSDEYTCYCISGYIEQGAPYCPTTVGQTYTCDITCLTCYGPSSDNCITCDSNNNRQINGTKCQCMAGFSSSVNTDPYCFYSSCDYTCTTCSGPNNNNCLSCVSTRGLSVNQCPCLPNYAEYQQSQDCYLILSSGCHYSCATCINNLVNGCITCPNQAFRQYQGASYTCSCQTYYVDQGGSVCAPNFTCNYSCETCDPTNTNYCYTCFATSNRILSNNKCPCQSGYIEYQQYLNCLQILNLSCHYSCLTCINNSDNGCVSCSSSSHRSYQQQTWTCPCDQYYVEDGVSMCKQNYACDYTCGTCNPLNSSQCITCPNNSNRILIIDSCVCDQGYIDYNQSQACLQIVSTRCQTCVNNLINGCVTCPLSSFRTYDSSNWQCPCDNNYTDIGNALCVLVQACNFKCQTCDPANGMKCYSCPLSSYRELVINSCICQNGYYDTGVLECQLIQQYCHPRCLTCFGSSDQQCITCLNTRTLLISGQSQQCICNQGTQELSVTYKCVAQIQNNFCYPLCQNCLGTSQNQCFSCINDTNVILQNESTCQCKENYNNVLNSSLCQINAINCDQTCNTCYLENSFNSCLSCRESDKRLLTQNQCLCISHYYDAGDQQCQACHYSCFDCFDSNKSSCLSCDTQNSLRIFSSNKCICQSNTQDIGNFNCKKIQCNIPGCLVCLDSQICQECNEQGQFELSGYVCKCSTGYFMNYQTCLSCQKYQNWLNPECTKIDCTDKIYMNGEQCDDGNSFPRDGCDNCKLQNGYMCQNMVGFPSQCFKCGDNCDECDNKLMCLKCSSQYNLIESFCIKCPANCNTCQNNKCIDCIRKFSNLPKNTSKQCPQCTDFDGYYNGQNECISRCGDGYTVLTEQCDDGNNINYDGCSSICQIEQGYNCIGNICFRLEQPQMVSQQLFKDTYNIYNSQRFVILNFTKFINCPNSIIQHFNFQINQEDQSLYQIIPSRTNSGFFQSILLQLLFDILISDSDGLQLKSYVSNTTLDDYIFVNQAVKQTTQIFSDFNSYLLYFLLILVVLAIIIGGVDIFWNLLDLLQLLSYTLFIDTQYPYNLQTFLNLFKFGQLQFLSNLIYIQSFINVLTDAPSIPQQKPKGKFSLQYNDTLFINNIASVITTFIISYFIYLFYSALIWMGQQLSQKIGKQMISNSNQMFYLNLLKFKSHVLNFVKEYNETFLYSGLIRVHMSTTYDLTFAILLSYQNQYETSSILYASYQLANIFLTIHIMLIFLYLYIINLSQFTLQTQKYQNNYGKALFSGINDSKQINLFYNVFLIFKRTTPYIYHQPPLFSTLIINTMLGLLRLIEYSLFIIIQPIDLEV